LATEIQTLFKNYGRGIATCRDDWAYDFDKIRLTDKIQRLINTYNSELDRWKRRGSDPISIDDFVTYDDKRIKWSEGLKTTLQRGLALQFEESKIRRALYRPFSKAWIYFDRTVVERTYQMPQIFPAPASEQENVIIGVTGVGADHQTFLAARHIVDVKFGINGNSAIQCFPYYTYAEDGSNRRENITDWALKQFQAKYGESVNKWDIFHYIYAMLHHPQYRERYAENLKRDLPHIPLLQRIEAYQAAVRIGQALMDLHVNYEQQEPYLLTPQEDPSVPFGELYIVEKMKFTPDRTAVIVNKGLTLAGIPDACFRYRLGNRSALEWVIDQYQVSKDARSGITSDPNRLDDPEYIVRLVKQVVTVSVKTVALVDELAQAVTMEDWMEEIVAGKEE
ncbi:MAG TPA: type ISP restriction/modification enzyme, partial [Ktedonobacteraceae bacterium]|nr:type ISP restriction/modification enzyme [Ktedonobacteraceae bacterium]